MVVKNVKRADPVLDFLSDLYLLLDAISVGVSRPSSYPTSYCLLTTLTTNYCSNQVYILISLRRECLL